MIWLVVIWVVFISLWGAGTPGISADAMKRVARGRRLWSSSGAHPFDWAKD